MKNEEIKICCLCKRSVDRVVPYDGSQACYPCAELVIELTMSQSSQLAVEQYHDYR